MKGEMVMNKHAVAFVSVFSLALVLCVYYLMIPKNAEVKAVGNEISDNSATISSARSYYFETLSKERYDGYSQKMGELSEELINLRLNY